MGNPTENEIGYSIQITGAIGDTATFPSVLNTFFQRTGTTFAMVFDICFSNDNYNVFFGGSGGSSSFKLMRNKTANTVDLELIDESADHRDYTWPVSLNRGKWYNFIVNGSGSGASGIALYIDGVAQTISAQTNAAGYDAAVSMTLKFGDIDATNLGGFKFAKPYFYNRNLTAGEITAIKQIRQYPSDFSFGWNFKRPNIGLNFPVTF
jgi:hypothetical protein